MTSAWANPSLCSGLFVNLHGWWLASGSIFVAMEYLRYGDLSRYAEAGLPEADIRDITKDVLRGLDVMHQNNFTHRDIKPQNILVVQKRPENARWWVKIADFGISKKTLNTADTALHTMIGTRPYCAPEILGYLKKQQHTSHYTNKVDMWSIGCVLFNLSSQGQLPFSEPDLVRYCDGNIKFKPHNAPVCLGEQGMLLLTALLAAEPESRPTAPEALKHSWFYTVASLTLQDRLMTPTSLEAVPRHNFNSFLDSPLPTRPVIGQVSSDHVADSTTIIPITSAEVTDSTDAHKTGRMCNEDMLASQASLPSVARWSSQRDMSAKSALKSVAMTSNSLGDQPLSKYIPPMDTYQCPTEVQPSSRYKSPIATDQPTAGLVHKVGSSIMHDLKDGEELILYEWLKRNEILLRKNAHGGFHGHPLLLAALQGNLGVIKLLSKKGAYVAESDKHGYTSLHFAASVGHLEVIKWLVTEHNANVHEKTQIGYTPLHLAASEGNLEVVKWLTVEQNANVHEKTSAGDTPLHFAASVGHLEVLKWLVIEQNANVHEKNKDGRTPQYHAAANGHLEVLKWLVIEHNADIHEKARRGLTPLHQAAWQGHLEVLKWLVIEQSADLHEKDDHGQTALHHAAYEGQLDTAKWLVVEGKADIFSQDNKNQTPREVAEIFRRTDFAAWLKEREALARKPDQQGQLSEAPRADQVADRPKMSPEKRNHPGKKSSKWRKLMGR